MKPKAWLMLGIYTAFTSAAWGNSTTPLSPLSNLPPGDLTFYAQTIQDWPNPVLSVNTAGVSFFFPRAPSAAIEKVMTVAQTRAALLALPTSQWPLGRIVVVMQQCILSGGDDQIIQQHFQGLKKMLAELGVEINLWPCA